MMILYIYINSFFIVSHFARRPQVADITVLVLISTLFFSAQLFTDMHCSFEQYINKGGLDLYIAIHKIMCDCISIYQG